MAYYPNYNPNHAEVSRNAKFNLGLPYSNTLHNQTIAIDRAFAAADVTAIVSAIRTLFRQVSPKLTEKEKEEFRDKFQDLAPFYRREAELKDKLRKNNSIFNPCTDIKREISINKNGTFAVLEELDMFLRKLLENHKLLIPDVKESASLFE